MPTPYDLNLPCLNPQCKSHGMPHPNCRCYGFAHGGEVGHFCSTEREHGSGCEYYAGGGKVEEALPSFDEMKAMQNGATTEEKTNEPLPSFDEMKAMQGGESVKPSTEEKLPSFDEMKAMQEVTPVKGAAPEIAQPTDNIEQLKAGAEGIAQGLIGDLAKVVQVKSGISTLEDIERREREFPLTHDVSKGVAFAGSLAYGVPKAIAAVGGSKILGNMLAASAFSLSDNTAKAFLGQPGGDVGSVVAGTILRGGMEGMMNTITSGLFSAAPGVTKAVLQRSEDVSKKFLTNLAEKPVTKAITAAGSYLGATKVGMTGIVGDLAEMEMIRKAAKPWIEDIIGRPLTKANKWAGDAILNTLSKTDFLGVPYIFKWAERASSGIFSVSAPIEALFKSGTHMALDETQKSVVEQINQWMEEGGIDGELQRSQQDAPQGFAKGGQVQSQNRSFESLYPTENIMLNQARARVSGYLNTLRPSKNPQKLPFDADPSQKQKQKSYAKAVRYAANPMSVLGDLNKGMLTTEDVTHFKSLWPEVHEFLSSKMTERIVKAQMDGEKPPYRKRQAMSLFLGADLDSSFSPQVIAKVQGMYSAKKPQPMPQAGKRGSSKAVAKSSNQYLTDEQARERRMQNQK